MAVVVAHIHNVRSKLLLPCLADQVEVVLVIILVEDQADLL
jgi:hypothetical protein